MNTIKLCYLPCDFPLKWLKYDDKQLTINTLRQ